MMIQPLSTWQKMTIIGSAKTRNEVAAMIVLILELKWFEAGVLEVLQYALLRVRDLPPTPDLFRQGPSDDMASEAMAHAIAKAANADPKDQLEMVMEQIAKDEENPLHQLFAKL